MKINIKNIILCLSLITLIAFSCKKDPETVSEVFPAIFPIVVLKGIAIIALPLGSGEYTDAGAYSIDPTTTDSLVTELTAESNNVDASKPGFYSVKYTGKTIRGFLTSATRFVLVSEVDGDIDYSGVYARSSNGQTVNVTKRGPGLYTTDNVGGVPGNASYIFDVYFGQVNDTTLEVPLQNNPIGGDIYCDVKSFIVSADDTSFTWSVLGSGFGTQERTFSHQ
jgi:Domain of unknown function (DUF5011)